MMTTSPALNPVECCIALLLAIKMLLHQPLSLACLAQWEIGWLQAQKEAEKGKPAAGFGSEQVLKKSQNVFKVKPLLCSSYECYRQCRKLRTDKLVFVCNCLAHPLVMTIRSLW